MVESSPLLALPPELRNHIYREVLVHNNNIIIITKSTKPPSLLQLCREIRFEAQGIYLAENRFMGQTTSSFDPKQHDWWALWLRSLGTERRTLLRSFEIFVAMEEEEEEDKRADVLRQMSAWLRRECGGLGLDVVSFVSSSSPLPRRAVQEKGMLACVLRFVELLAR
ncbi:hypothetical protein AC578_2493 [Pseudocercospora eumusae]|uniref:F-box domain-containing protein n=1 Tax=Pseudocercospora eumusae TaxID=321146 RepID=A0A139HXG1_9PEZI|nr:hypothetical protein AC578_2493 [Pseudocercospora eumusae]